jgi:glycosyltransferase involved in cell wall biosynthesis
VSRKIAVLAPDLSGGGGTRVYLIAQVLQQLGYEVTVYGFVFGEKLYPVPPTNLEVKWVKGGNFPEFFGQSWQLIQQIEADAIYAIKPRLTSFGVGLLKRAVGKKPLLLDIDDWEMSWFAEGTWQYRPTPKQLARDLLKSDGSLRNPSYPLYLQWMESLVKQAQAVTVNTTFLQQRFGGIYLPNGKDTRLFDPKLYSCQLTREKYGLSPYRVLMFPGTARPHKGLEDALTALDYLQEPDLRLVVVGGRSIGDGYLEQLLEKWPQWLIHLPPQPLAQMGEVVAAADIVIVPQRASLTAQAQFPIKLTDGMAMAKPIISTCVGDIPKILAGVGYLVEPNSPEQIADKIRWVFQNLEAAQQTGQLAREKCMQEYSLQKMSTILSKMLTSLISI